MECDAQGIVFNGAYWATWKSPRPSISATWGFPFTELPSRVTLTARWSRPTWEFKAPARVDEQLELYARVTRIGNTSLTLRVEIYPEDSERLLTLIEAVYVGFYAESGTTRRCPTQSAP